MKVSFMPGPADFSVPKAAKRKHKVPLLTLSSGDWTYHVFKINRKMDDPYASAFCRVVSPMTSQWGDLSDTYIRDIVADGPDVIAIGEHVVDEPVMIASMASFAKLVHLAAATIEQNA